MDLLGAHRQQLGARVPERPARRLVDLDQLAGPPFFIEGIDQDGVAAGVEQGAVSALALELPKVGRIRRVS